VGVIHQPTTAADQAGTRWLDVTQSEADLEKCPSSELSVAAAGAGPVPHDAGLIRSLSTASDGVTRHSLAAGLPAEPTPSADRQGGYAVLAELVSHVIGVDTHKDTHTGAVVCARTGGVEATETVPAAQRGYESLLEFADAHSAAGERAWAIEGTGSYGAGLTAFLQARGEWVVEVDRPSRPAQRNGAKSDLLDAVRAAREALGRQKWAEPRARGAREAMRVLYATRNGAVCDRTRAINELKALVVSAPEELRERLRGVNGAGLVAACARLRDAPGRPSEHRAAVAALRRLAARIRHLDEEIKAHDKDLAALTAQHCPQVVAEFGVGPITAAQAYISWSHPGRCRSEAAYANLGGVAPIEASSGKVVRHRLNRGGDRQLNRALHTIVLTRARMDPLTKEYVARRTAEGKSEREVRRCLKRYVARHLYRLLEAGPPTGEGAT
jgi:transposase